MAWTERRVPAQRRSLKKTGLYKKNINPGDPGGVWRGVGGVEKCWRSTLELDELLDTTFN